MPQKIIIIGAPRSGTNMLRNMLVKIEGVESWPCDEINYIWRHGNKNHESDEFTPEMATPKIRKFINNEFDKFSRASQAEIIVEKTCASSMRVGFVNEVVPDAKYIFIIRDGYDTVASAKLRWKAKLDIPYLIKKVRFVPIVDLPFYGIRYISSHIYRLFSKEKRVSFWGPQMNNMPQLLNKYSLTQVCALQWLTCVENSERDLANIAPNKVYRIRYEDFTKDPSSEFKKITHFIGKDVNNKILESVVANVSSKSIGKGKKMLSKKQVEEISPLIRNCLDKYGYFTK